MYEIMCCLFFQGCVELIMSGRGEDIVNTVAYLLYDFWKSARFYKETERLHQFYADTFCYIGRRFLYINEEPKDRYNEQTVEMQRFIQQLIYNRIIKIGAHVRT